jgi:hypothetical protein
LELGVRAHAVATSYEAEVEVEVVYRRACIHHHCMDCRGDEQRGCAVCAMEAEGK